jgi:acylphosphatase
VRVIAEGRPAELDRLLRHLNAGPPGARVDIVDASRGPASGEFSSFVIRSAGHRGD